jgi:hypothetical protein
VDTAEDGGRHWSFGMGHSDKLDGFMTRPLRIECSSREGFCGQKWQFFTERIVVMGTPNNEPG